MNENDNYDFEKAATAVREEFKLLRKIDTLWVNNGTEFTNFHYYSALKKHGKLTCENEYRMEDTPTMLDGSTLTSGSVAQAKHYTGLFRTVAAT